jgi:hypothetical protein
MTAILSVNCASELMKLSRLFDVLLAESAAKAASFFGATLDANAIQPSPNQPPEPIDRQEKPGEEIPWENLIDFSQ